MLLSDGMSTPPTSTTMRISELNHAAASLAVYASWDGLPHRCTQDSLPACWLGVDRAGLSREGTTCRFQDDIGIPPSLCIRLFLTQRHSRLVLGEVVRTRLPFNITKP